MDETFTTSIESQVMEMIRATIRVERVIADLRATPAGQRALGRLQRDKQRRAARRRLRGGHWREGGGHG